MNRRQCSEMWRCSRRPRSGGSCVSPRHRLRSPDKIGVGVAGRKGGTGVTARFCVPGHRHARGHPTMIFAFLDGNEDSSVVPRCTAKSPPDPRAFLGHLGTGEAAAIGLNLRAVHGRSLRGRPHNTPPDGSAAAAAVLIRGSDPPGPLPGQGSERASGIQANQPPARGSGRPGTHASRSRSRVSARAAQVARDRTCPRAQPAGSGPPRPLPRPPRAKRHRPRRRVKPSR